jgi:hypothetical protein
MTAQGFDRTEWLMLARLAHELGFTAHAARMLRAAGYSVRAAMLILTGKVI